MIVVVTLAIYAAGTFLGAHINLAVLYLTVAISIGRTLSNIATLFVRLTAGVLVVSAGPFTQASLNPACDFRQRRFIALAGWDSIAIPGPRNECG